MPAAKQTAPKKSEGLARLRDPFEAAQINFLPRAVSKADQDKYQCRAGTKGSVDGKFCGGYHTRSIHLDYVGHAALTDRFLEVDEAWTWEPVAFGPDGLPARDRDGGMWIRLTILGVTRLGYGDAQGKTGPNAVKEVIGDALRNAGMRFGAALDLWHKGDMHDAAEEQGRTDARADQPVEAVKTAQPTPQPQPEPDSQGRPDESFSTTADTTPPDGWRAKIAAAQSVDDLTNIYNVAAQEQWANPDVMSALGYRKRAILEADTPMALGDPQ